MEKTVYGTSSPACVGGGFPRGGMAHFSFLPFWSLPFSSFWRHWSLRCMPPIAFWWASWHLPVINYLGTATPHGAYWYAFFLAFTVAMTAMRVLIFKNSAHTE